ncbi:hypothetical protein JTE90_029614 [Oedothorax gibbosus]|uniref:Elongation of very long chain fatty acids protein n=1 Tax=Oedothorax gibbosus TaxID=931172 RepID=A0AAV6VGC6_9ARAC|nr:hypothetical protein JTE90_029614 [Oedothorax gibbosus]
MSVFEDISNFLYAEDYHDRALIKHPSIIITTVFVYLLLVKWIIPHLMRNRKPFSLKWAMIIYDFGQTFVNAYLTYNLFTFSFSLWDERCMMKTNPNLPVYQKRINVIAWRIYLVKIADLIDTIMFALRKKDDQVSFLHVFHHCLMCVLVMFFLRSLDKTSMGYFLGVGLSINTTVHVFVYFYYGLAAFGPHMNKYLWWKKYLTQFQIVQFFVVLSYIGYGWATGCEEVGRMEVSLFVYVLTILFLFFNFYKKYEKK